MPEKASRSFVAVIAVLVFAAAGVAVWLVVRKGNRTEDSPNDKLFREAAVASGINFRMNFLPSEQGENFKINLYDHGAGVAVGDYDGDGLDDIYLVNQLGNCALYRNKGDGTFEDKTEEAGVGLGDHIYVSATFADYDNDGRQDLFVTSTRGGNVLFHNEGNGKFRDVTEQAGVKHIGHCQSAHFFDYDNDGRLDLLVTGTAQWTLPDAEPLSRYFFGKSSLPETAGSEREYNILYHNEGKGTFSIVPDAGGLKGRGWAADAAILDYDGDGFFDVVITNMFGPAQLYRNNRKGGFVDVTKEVLGCTSWGGMGVYPFDFNNDGKLDFYIVDMHSDMERPDR